MPPPQTTLIFKFPSTSHGCLLGIDTQFFHATEAVRGVKNVPDGVHFFHFSDPLSTPEQTASLSLRHGVWLNCTEGNVFMASWDSGNERIVVSTVESEYSEDLGNIYPYLLDYPENITKWQNLVNYIDFEVLTEYVPYDGVSSSYTNEVTTVMSSKEESMVLSETLQQKIEVPELKYTILEFKKQRNSSDITGDFLDKSWYLQELFGHDIELFYGELQLSFVHFIVLGNFCSGFQWCNLLRLVLMSSSFVKESQSFTMRFLDLWLHQLQALPTEYLNGDGLNALDMKTYIGVLENFAADIFADWTKECCGRMKLGGVIQNKWNDIKVVHRQKFNLDVNALVSKHENGFEVYDLDNHDENDEDAPVIV